MTDQRLLNLIEAARKLDDGDNVTLEQCESCRQYSQIIACSLPELPYDFENCRPGDYADATEAAIHRLAIAMYQHADALFRIKKFKGDQWATEMHKQAREEFRTARIEAEMLATGHVSAATLIATTAEAVAPTPADDVTLDDDEVTFVNSSEAAQQCQMSPGDWEFQVAPLTTQNRPF
jgi:hypothetical protein